MQILRRTPATLTVTYPGPPGAVAVDVARLDGTLIRSAAPATVNGNDASVTLTIAETSVLDTFTATFTSLTYGDLTTTGEVVGAVLFTVPEARAFDKKQLADTTAFPDAAILDARERITEQFARVCGVSFIPRYRLATVSGEDWYTWTLPDRPLLTVRSAGTRVPGAAGFVALTSDQLAALDSDFDAGLLTRGVGYFTSSLYSELRLPAVAVQIGYEYGYRTPPPPIKRAALIVAVNQLVPSNIPERTMSFSDVNGQTFRYATAGVGRFSPFGLPLVDETLRQYRETQAGIA